MELVSEQVLFVIEEVPVILKPTSIGDIEHRAVTGCNNTRIRLCFEYSLIE